MPLHMESKHPDVLAVLESEFRLVRRFEGSLGDGDIYVFRSERSPTRVPSERPGAPDREAAVRH